MLERVGFTLIVGGLSLIPYPFYQTFPTANPIRNSLKTIYGICMSKGV